MSDYPTSITPKTSVKLPIGIWFGGIIGIISITGSIVWGASSIMAKIDGSISASNLKMERYYDGSWHLEDEAEKEHEESILPAGQRAVMSEVLRNTRPKNLSQP